MSKVEGWAYHLDAYITAAATMPFSYDAAMGSDCCSFTFGAIHAQTGVDIGKQFRGKYHTQKEALRVMRAYCGKPSLAVLIEKLMAARDFREVPALYAQRGDAVLATGGEFLGVLGLNGRDVLGVGEDGVRRVPISRHCRAWRIC